MNQSHLMQLLREKLDHASAHRLLRDTLATFLQHSEVLASKLVEATGLRYDVDDPVAGTVPAQEQYAGQAGFVSRVQDGAECVVWTGGDESLVIATKDRRYEVAVEAGDVVVHSMPADETKQATIRLDGSTGDVHVTMPAGAKQTVTQGGTSERVLTESDITVLWDLLAGVGNPPLWQAGGTVLDAKTLQTVAGTLYTQLQTAGIGSPALEADD